MAHRYIGGKTGGDLELTADVAELARSVLREAGSAPEYLERAAEAWLATHGESAVPEIAALAHERPAHDHPGNARLAARRRDEPRPAIV